jgi:hypothetical protein
MSALSPPQQYFEQNLVFSIRKMICAVFDVEQSPDPAWVEEVECEECGGSFTRGERKMARLGISGRAWGE